MRKYLVSLVSVICTGVLLFAACESSNPASSAPLQANAAPSPSASIIAPVAETAPQSSPSDSVRRITIDETHAAIEKNEAVIVDVRSAQEYAANHIKGAISIPLNDVDARAKELPRDKLIITYCA